jgi:uncharacterized protein GlcG (DUF336 family)
MLTLATARQIADATLEAGAARGLAPLAVVVLDAGGNLLVALRDEKAGILRHEIAFAKAWGSLGLGFGSRRLAERVQHNPAFFAALSDVSGGRLAPSPGGVLILAQGQAVGAIGVSGDTGDADEACALTGIAAAGLEPKV